MANNSPKKREQTIKTLLDKRGTGTNYIELERDGRLNMVACSNYFVKNPLRLPDDLKLVNKDTRVKFYAFTCADNRPHAFYQDDDSNGKYLYEINDTILRKHTNLDMDTYLTNHEVIMNFLRKIQENTRRMITNIYIIYNATVNIDPNGVDRTSVFPWHDDRNFAEGKDSRQMAILLTDGTHTEFAIGKEPEPEEKAEQVLTCLSPKIGEGTYWRNPIIHRKPYQPYGTRRVAALLVFDFFYWDENSMDAIHSKIKTIKDKTIRRHIANEMTEMMQTKQGRMFDKEASVVLLGGDLGFVPAAASSPVKKTPPVNCLESDHPSCSAMFGGKKDTKDGKYKYKGRWYKVRYGARGGRHILVNGVVKYV